MKVRSLAIYLAFLIIEGIGTAIFLLLMKFDPGRGHLLNYQTIRIVLEVFLVLVIVGLVILFINLLINPLIGRRIINLLNDFLISDNLRLFRIQAWLLISTLLLVECYFLTYLSFPIPLRPLITWAALVGLQTWIFFRVGFARAYSQRPGFRDRIKSAWHALMPVQRKTFIFLVIIGMFYFLAFAPINFLRDNQTHFYIHPDEETIYPDIVKVLVWQGSFDATIHNILDGWQWWYGYPYLPMSAAVLVIPRLIFGEGFGAQEQLNIFLLRQFISVLPMVLALLLLDYLITRFKNFLYSIGLFIFLLFIPGIIKFNFHFWHPDGIILLLILMTFWFLERDQLRFRTDFYLAAVTCALAMAIKLWGAFFVLAIAGYLAAGWYKKILSPRRLILAGLGFIGVMILTLAISSPTLLVPYVTRSALEGWQAQQAALLHGYAEPDPEGVYKTGLVNWLRFFDLYFMENYIFFTSCAALVIGSLIGMRKYMNRLLLAWFICAGTFLIWFGSMKSNHYMIPVMLPLYGGLFLIPYLHQPVGKGKIGTLFSRPITSKVIWGIAIILLGSQFILNIYNIVTSHAVGINDFFLSLF